MNANSLKIRRERLLVIFLAHPRDVADRKRLCRTATN